MTTKAEGLEKAILECQKQRKSHRIQAMSTLTAMILFTGFLVIVIPDISGRIHRTMQIPSYLHEKQEKDQYCQGFTHTTSVLSYIPIGLSVFGFGVAMALYRFHLNQIVRLESMELGFTRIKLAMDLDADNEHSEVLRALLSGALCSVSHRRAGV